MIISHASSSSTLLSCYLQEPEHRRLADSEFNGDLLPGVPCRLHRAHHSSVDGRLAASVAPLGLRLGDAFSLALFPQVGFELGENPQHVEERLASGSSGVDRLLGAGQGRALVPDGADDGLQVGDGAGKTVDASDYQHVVGSEKVEDQLQHGAAGGAGARRLLLPDNTALGSLEGRDLDRDVLIKGADTSISDAAHGPPSPGPAMV